MSCLKYIFLFLFVSIQLAVDACTIVAVSGKATIDGRPLLLKNRDSDTWDLQIKIGQGSKYIYLCQCKVTDGFAYSGYNEAGFSIINSNSSNMPNSDQNKNAYIMQLALERCATIDEFEYLLDSIQKPLSVRSNYGVMDAKGNVAVFEVNAYNYTKFDAAETEEGYLIRSNFSFSPISSDADVPNQNSYNRYKIASSYIEKLYRVNGFITKEDLFHLTRFLVNSMEDNLYDIAAYDENVYTPVKFTDYIPRYESTSMMVIQGVLPDESPKTTVAWTAIGPPVATVVIPYMMTSHQSLPQKAKMNEEGHAWLCSQGHLLKERCFVDSKTLDLAKLYNLKGTGIMQQIMKIEEAILDRGKELIEMWRTGEASDNDVELYYAWVDDYLEEQYAQIGNCFNGNTGFEAKPYDYDGEMKFYDMLGRPVIVVKPDALFKKCGNIGIILN